MLQEHKKELLAILASDPQAFDNIKNFKGKFYDSMLWGMINDYHKEKKRKDQIGVDKAKSSIAWFLNLP